MDREYEVRGAFIAKDGKGEKDFWEIFTGFVEDYGWYYGGKLDDEETHLIETDIVIDVSANYVDPDELYTLLTELAERNGYQFSGVVNQTGV